MVGSELPVDRWTRKCGAAENVRLCGSVRCGDRATPTDLALGDASGYPKQTDRAGQTPPEARAWSTSGRRPWSRAPFLSPSCSGFKGCGS